MNRLSQPLSQIKPVKAATDLVEAGRFASREENGAHALFAPLHYERNYAYPLLVWLHGAGDNETSLRRIMPLISMRNYVAVAPRGQLSTGTGRDQMTWDASPAGLESAETRVFDTIDRAMSRYKVATDRVFLVGYDCGGTLAFQLAMQYPSCFAGVVSLCGRFPQGGTPLAELNQARRVPLLMSCGQDSSSCSPDDASRSLRLFHAAGMDISLRQYPCGQELTTHMLADTDRWIMELINRGHRAAGGIFRRPEGF